MYLALKNALGKSFILFSGLLNKFSGATAAYSFRNLNNAYAGPIVEVRRGIDTNTDTNERDFSIGDFNQVADWVNGLQETTLPANVASSAAAYSLRKINSSYSGDVVRIRRASDNVEVNVGFDSQDEVSASSPITNTTEQGGESGSTTATTLGEFLTEGGNQDATVHTWYDQSGNAKDATQDASGEQPKIADSGNIVTRLGKTSIDFTTSKTFLENSSVSITETEVSYFSVWQPAKDGATATEAKNRTLFAISSNGTFIQTPNTANQMQWKRFGTTNAFALAVANLNTPNLHTAIGTSSGANYYFNSSSIYSDSLTGSNTTRTSLRIGTRILVDSHQTTGYISEFLIYNSDQSSNRFRIESNINNYYGIYTAENNGFVSKWYDQSGNSNHATQNTGDSQPKIVSAGSLTTQGGKPCLDFDGVDDGLVTSDSYTTTGWGFAVYDPTSNTEALVSNSKNLALTVGSKMRVGSSGNNEDFTLPNLNQQIGSFNFGSTAECFINGVAISKDADETSPANSSKISIGFRDGDLTPSLFWSSTISEVILYPTDQSANRADIESNIDDYYDII